MCYLIRVWKGGGKQEFSFSPRYNFKIRLILKKVVFFTRFFKIDALLEEKKRGYSDSQ